MPLKAFWDLAYSNSMMTSTDFEDRCAFLCDAFASIAMQEDILEPATARGLGIYAQWISEQVSQIKADFKPIYEDVSQLLTASRSNKH